jgi:Fic family protein
MDSLPPLTQLPLASLETPAVLKRVTQASRQLAELKGIVASVPNPAILINTLVLQEAKDSSAIENIVTTHDDLYKEELFPEGNGRLAAKEVRDYARALQVGFELVKRHGFLTGNHLQLIQNELEGNGAGFRKLPGTALKNSLGETVYTPPQNPEEILALIADLERFLNADDAAQGVDPLVKMAVLHYQFESIHPFYDGNGRTGRILNVLYLVLTGLLDIPVLYLSRYIVRNKANYYRLLQAVRTESAWEEWTLYMLVGVEETARETIVLVQAIQAAYDDYRRRIRGEFKFYSQDLVESLFVHPYTKIDFLERELGVSRLTATKYLDQLAAGGFLTKRKIGRSSYYINGALFHILAGDE